MTVYVLHHVYEPRTGGEEVKLVGIYSTKENAEAAIARAAGKPGFRDHPDGFDVSTVTVDHDHWVDGFIRE